MLKMEEIAAHGEDPTVVGMGEGCEWPLKAWPSAPWQSVLLTGWRAVGRGWASGDVPWACGRSLMVALSSQ